MQAVEKEGLKLYDKVSLVKGDQSEKLQKALEDCDRHGAYNSYFCSLYKNGKLWNL